MARRTPAEITELAEILTLFGNATDDLRQNYGNDLKASLAALRNNSDVQPSETLPPTMSDILASTSKTRSDLRDLRVRICSALFADDSRFEWLNLGHLWPCTSPVTLLEQLRSNSNHRIEKTMAAALVSYGVLFTSLQRLLRMRASILRKDNPAVLAECLNVGHENWDPSEFRDWLLLEIDGNIMIRAEQVEVAREIISPASGSNSVLQMNMGKGTAP